MTVLLRVAGHIEMMSPRRLLSVFGVDRAIGYTILLQAFTMISRPLLLGVMTVCLSVEEQGYQYTILGLIGLKALFELGMGVALIHVVGRDGERMVVRPGRAVTGDSAAINRLASLVRKTVFGYAVIAGLFIAVMLPVGSFVLGSARETAIRWESAWLIAVLATGLGFPIHGAINVLIGTGNMSEILRLRLGVGVVQAAVYGGLLWAGAGLAAAPAGVAVAVVFEAGGLVIRFGRPLLELWRRPIGAHGVDWRREVLPLQWRVGVSWLSNYLLAQALIPIAFRYCGESAAGRLGLTLSLVAMLQGLSFGWVATKWPQYAAAVGAGRIAEMRRAFARDLRYAGTVYFTGGVFGVLGLAALAEFRPAIAARALPAEWLAVALIAGAGWLIVECLGNVLNTFHRDPLMPLRIAVASATLLAGWLFAESGGITGLVSLMAMASVVSAGCAYGICRRFLNDPPALVPTGAP